MNMKIFGYILRFLFKKRQKTLIFVLKTNVKQKIKKLWSEILKRVAVKVKNCRSLGCTCLVHMLICVLSLSFTKITINKRMTENFIHKCMKFDQQGQK